MYMCICVYVCVCIYIYVYTVYTYFMYILVLNTFKTEESLHIRLHSGPRAVDRFACRDSTAEWFRV